MLKVVFVYPKNASYFQRDSLIMLYYNFFLEGMKENPRIDYTVAPVDSPVDATQFKNFDVIIFWSCSKSTLEILNADKLKRIKCVRGQDPIDMDEEWRQTYLENNFDFVFFHGMKEAYPRHCKFTLAMKYESVICGVDERYYSLSLSFKNREKKKILSVGSGGSKETVLRRLMMDSSQTDYIGSWAGFTGNDFSKLLVTYQAACVSMKNFIVPKYIELPIAGCLTFMGANEINGIEELSFIDNETCVYVTVENFRQKFDEYLNTVDDPRWEKIAVQGRIYAEKMWSNKVQVDKFIDLMEEYV